MRLKFSIILLLLGTNLFSASWVEDYYGFQFEFPRGWHKNVVIGEDSGRIELSMPEAATVTFDVYTQDETFDLDRYIEFRLDEIVKTYGKIKVKQEIRFGPARGFDNTVFLVVHYKEKEETVSNRFFFSRHGQRYYTVHCRTNLKKYPEFKKPFDLMMKSFRSRVYDGVEWRNDSLNYVNKAEIAEIVQRMEKVPDGKFVFQDKRYFRKNPVMKKPLINVKEEKVKEEITP